MYGTAASEVEIDVLTGEVTVLQTDVIMDIGESINPAIDIGQIEGAFIMGLGLHMTEEVIFDKDDGSLATGGTWNYKPPSAMDIPLVFNVALKSGRTDTVGFKRAKCVGEPPYALSSSVYFAIRHAIEAARAEAAVTEEDKEFFSLPSPLTPRQIQQGCMVGKNQFILA